jgi:hypothetical protein
MHDDRVDPAVTQERHVGGERASQRVVDHRIAAVFDHHDLAVQLFEPGQRFGQHVGLRLGRHCAGNHDE